MRNDRTSMAGFRATAQRGLALLCVLAAGDAYSNTYFKCVDAKGAVTVQQTACAAGSAQQEKKVWSANPQVAQPPAPPVPERPPSLQRRSDEPAKSITR